MRGRKQTPGDANCRLSFQLAVAASVAAAATDAAAAAAAASAVRRPSSSGRPSSRARASAAPTGQVAEPAGLSYRAAGAVFRFTTARFRRNGRRSVQISPGAAIPYVWPVDDAGARVAK